MYFIFDPIASKGHDWNALESVNKNVFGGELADTEFHIVFLSSSIEDHTPLLHV